MRLFSTLYQRPPELRFFMLFGSPAMLIIVLCTSNGEREEIVSPFLNGLLKISVHKVFLLR